MNCGGRFIGMGPLVASQQLRETFLVEIADRAFAIGLDPFGMLRPKIVMNLKLKGRECALRTRPDNLRSHRFWRSEHCNFDNGPGELVRFDARKIYFV
jgi:hypothetical protein